MARTLETYEGETALSFCNVTYEGETALSFCNVAIWHSNVKKEKHWKFCLNFNKIDC